MKPDTNDWQWQMGFAEGVSEAETRLGEELEETRKQAVEVVEGLQFLVKSMGLFGQFPASMNWRGRPVMDVVGEVVGAMSIEDFQRALRSGVGEVA